MRTSGRGNDSLIILMPVAVGVIVSVMLFGGPRQTLDTLNTIVGETARAAMTMMRALFS
jgi:hypothetical protein